MPPPATKAQKTSATEPHRTMRPRDDGGTIRCVIHLTVSGRRRIATGSGDGSIRLWDVESGTQVGNDWRDAGDEAHVYSMALSPSGKTIAAGTSDGIVRLWDVGTRRVVAKSAEHTLIVWTICWSADGEHVVSGALDRTARVWNVGIRKMVLNQLIRAGHEVYAVVCSPDMTQVATGGYDEAGITIKIWDWKTGALLTTVKHNSDTVFSLAWASDQRKLISGSGDGSVKIFDTTTWKELTTLKGHQNTISSLSINNHLLASASWDQTTRLWNIDTNLAIGPPLQHEDSVNSVAISSDGKLLVTGCEDDSTQVWDIPTILKNAVAEGISSIPDTVTARKSLMDTGATTRRPAQLQNVHRLPQGFFDDAQDSVQPPMTRVTHSRFSFRRRRALVRPPTSHPFAFLGRLSSLVHRPQPNTEGPTELQQRPSQTIPSHHEPPVVEVAAIRDKGALYVAERPEPISEMAKRIKNPSWWTRCVLFICCVPIPDTNTSTP